MKSTAQISGEMHCTLAFCPESRNTTWIPPTSFFWDYPEWKSTRHEKEPVGYFRKSPGKRGGGYSVLAICWNLASFEYFLSSPERSLSFPCRYYPAKTKRGRIQKYLTLRKPKGESYGATTFWPGSSFLSHPNISERGGRCPLPSIF